jgi:hypothetical protein
MKLTVEFEVDDHCWHGFIPQFEVAIEAAINSSDAEILESCELLETHVTEGE